MKHSKIIIVLLLCILLASGLACSLFGGGTEPTPTPKPPSALVAPTLSSPNNGATVYGTSITFQWNASPGATSYFLRVSNSAYPNLDHETSFISKNLGNVKKYTVSGFPDDGTDYVWGVWSGNNNGWCPKPGVLANARILTNGVQYGASLRPQYVESYNTIYFILTTYAKEPVYLDISNPDGSLLDRVYVPPTVETPEITRIIALPPTPSGGTYKFNMFSDVTGELVWEGEQKFAGPIFKISALSLNPHWVIGEGWDLQYLQMNLQNVGDMPIILNGLKLRLEKSSFSTEEITIAREGDVEAAYGWTIYNWTIKGKFWGLEPYNESSMTTTILPWGSEEQYLFGQYFDPGEYLLHVTLSEQLNVLPVPELAFESPP